MPLHHTAGGGAAPQLQPPFEHLFAIPISSSEEQEPELDAGTVTVSETAPDTSKLAEYELVVPAASTPGADSTVPYNQRPINQIMRASPQPSELLTPEIAALLDEQPAERWLASQQRVFAAAVLVGVGAGLFFHIRRA